MISVTYSRTHTAAFTLMELLVVMIVLSILLVVVAPTLVQNTAASRLTNAGDLVLNKLSEAQQQAIAENSEVEVRFFETVAPGSLDQVPRLHSLKFFTLGVGEGSDGNGRFIPSSSLIRLDEGVVISSKPKISSLIEAGFKQEETVAEPADRYLSLRFLPDGSTELPEGSPWFITLVLQDTEAKPDVPANFYTVQIDPVTGRVRSFRP